MGGLDVMVVGGGPAGSSCARALQTRGLRVAVLDRAEFPRDKICGDALSGKTVAILHELGLFEEARDLGAQIQVVSEPEVQAVHAILDQLGHAATVGAEHWNAGVEGLVDGQR